jgi:ubiquinone/menaquinone biosynthesis C-methylase UbiE
MRAVEQKAWKGKGMEGTVARWYARTRRNDMEDFCREAKSVAEHLRSGCHVLEVAPGPGFFAVELAKLGDFKITGLDISQTLVEIATENARNAGAKVDFRLGNASSMPFAGESFDFIYCSAAFKNFSEPVKALDEMYRVLRPGGEAVVLDLCKDAPLDEIDTYVKQSGRSRIDAWMTKWTFRHVLLKRAYTKEEFVCMAAQSRFGTCQINVAPIGFEVRLTKPSWSRGSRLPIARRDGRDG